jgi:hypothetical protein
MWTRPTVPTNDEINEDLETEMEAEHETLDTLEPTTITTLNDVVMGLSGTRRGSESGKGMWPDMSDEIC